jgi:glycosyltransferase involved in cell wall biosynthesis
VDRAGAAGLLKAAEFFVLPSRADEGLPMVCLEAMTAGKAIVASRVGGVPEFVIDEENGLLVAREDVSQLAQAIGRLLGDKKLRSRLGAAGQVRVAKFTWDNIAAQYEQVYADAIRAARRQASAQPAGKYIQVAQQH